MIQSIHKGHGFRGVLNYVLDPAKSPEIVAGNMYGEDARTLAAEFGELRRLAPRLGKPVFHSSLSLPHGPDGRETLSETQWREVVEAYLEHLGFDTSQFVAVRHRDTDHDHVHVIASRIGADGRTVSDSHDYRRGEEVLRRLERRYELTPVRGSRQAERNALREAELRHLARDGSVSVRLRLHDLLDRAAAGARSMGDLVERLECAGVEVVPRVARTGHVSGISFALDGVAFKGSSLGRAYSWQGLVRRVGHEAERDLPVLRRVAEAVAGRSRDGGTWSPEALRALAAELGRLKPARGKAGLARATAELAVRGGGYLPAPARAVRLALAFAGRPVETSLRHTRGGRRVEPLLAPLLAARSPLGVVLYGARLATSAGRWALARTDRPAQERSTRQLVAAYARAAAIDKPEGARYVARLREAGIEPLPLVDGRGRVRAVAYRLGGEVVPGQDLGREHTWRALERRGVRAKDLERSTGADHATTRGLPGRRDASERRSRGAARDDRAAARDAPREPRREPGAERGGDGAARRPDRTAGTGGRGGSGGAQEPRERAAERRAGIADRSPDARGASVGDGRRPPRAGRGDGLEADVAPPRRAAGGARARDAAPGVGRRGRGGRPGRDAGGGPPSARRGALPGDGADRLSDAALEAALRRANLPRLAAFRSRAPYATEPHRADAAWARKALSAEVPPHLVLRELARHGHAKPGRGADARLAHGTRVLAHALATARPGRPAAQSIDLAAQALAAVIQAPLVAVRALLLVRNLARELTRDRGR